MSFQSSPPSSPSSSSSSLSSSSFFGTGHYAARDVQGDIGSQQQPQQRRRRRRGWRSSSIQDENDTNKILLKTGQDDDEDDNKNNLIKDKRKRKKKISPMKLFFIQFCVPILFFLGTAIMLAIWQVQTSSKISIISTSTLSTSLSSSSSSFTSTPPFSVLSSELLSSTEQEKLDREIGKNEDKDQEQQIQIQKLSQNNKNNNNSNKKELEKRQRQEQIIQQQKKQKGQQSRKVKIVTSKEKEEEEKKQQQQVQQKNLDDTPKHITSTQGQGSKKVVKVSQKQQAEESEKEKQGSSLMVTTTSIQLGTNSDDKAMSDSHGAVNVVDNTTRISQKYQTNAQKPTMQQQQQQQKRDDVDVDAVQKVKTKANKNIFSFDDPMLLMENTRGSFLSGTEPNSNRTSFGYYKKLFPSGYRNQIMGLNALLMWCDYYNHTQILYETIYHKDTYGSNSYVPFSYLFDIEYWNAYAIQMEKTSTSMKVPRFVRCVQDVYTDINCTTFEWTVKNVSEATNPYTTKGEKQHASKLYANYMRYNTKRVGKLASYRGYRNPIDLAILRGILRPHPNIRHFMDMTLHRTIIKLREQEKGQLKANERKTTTTTMTTTTTRRNEIIDNDMTHHNDDKQHDNDNDMDERKNNEFTYFTLHARIEPDMQYHDVCRTIKVTNLTKIFTMMEEYFPQPPANYLFVPINRPLLEEEYVKYKNYKKEKKQRQRQQQQRQLLNTTTTTITNTNDNNNDDDSILLRNATTERNNNNNYNNNYNTDGDENNNNNNNMNINYLALYNLKVLNHARKYGLWNGTVQIFELGSGTLFDDNKEATEAKKTEAETKTTETTTTTSHKYPSSYYHYTLLQREYSKIPSIIGSVMNFEWSVNVHSCKVFIGTPVSSWSTDVVSSRFYRHVDTTTSTINNNNDKNTNDNDNKNNDMNDLRNTNFQYLPSGIRPWTTSDMIDAPSFNC